MALYTLQSHSGRGQLDTHLFSLNDEYQMSGSQPGPDIIPNIDMRPNIDAHLCLGQCEDQLMLPVLGFTI